MQLVTQPAGSKLCGQACIAMILGITLDEAVTLVGHDHGTCLDDITHACHTVVRIDRYLTRTSMSRKFPDEAILRYRYGRPARRESHWVLLWNCVKIYDPACSEPYCLGFDKHAMLNDSEVRITSFAQIHYEGSPLFERDYPSTPALETELVCTQP